jgi:hypothetical protein
LTSGVIAAFAHHAIAKKLVHMLSGLELKLREFGQQQLKVRKRT